MHLTALCQPHFVIACLPCQAKKHRRRLLLRQRGSHGSALDASGIGIARPTATATASVNADTRRLRTRIEIALDFGQDLHDVIESRRFREEHLLHGVVVIS